MFLFVYVRLGVHECGGFSFCFSIGCCCLFPFSSVCFRLFVSLRSCIGLHRLLFGSESQSHLWEFHAKGQVVTNRWRIHRLWFWLPFHWLLKQMDVALVFLRCPFCNISFHCHLSFAVYHQLFWYVIVCFCLFWFGCVCLSFGIHFLRFLTNSCMLLTFLLAFLRAVAFAFVLLSVAAVCSRSFPFVFVCLLPALLRWFASIVGGQWGHSRIFSCDEPSGNC